MQFTFFFFLRGEQKHVGGPYKICVCRWKNHKNQTRAHRLLSDLNRNWHVPKRTKCTFQLRTWWHDTHLKSIWAWSFLKCFLLACEHVDFWHQHINHVSWLMCWYRWVVKCITGFCLCILSERMIACGYSVDINKNSNPTHFVWSGCEVWEYMCTEKKHPPDKH